MIQGYVSLILKSRILCKSNKKSLEVIQPLLSPQRVLYLKEFTVSRGVFETPVCRTFLESVRKCFGRGHFR